MTTREERYATFTREIEAAGIDLDAQYHGRNHYDGPAAKCHSWDDAVEAIRATTGPVQWDNLGSGFVIYPR